jgi:solute carrier family 35 (UDP-sugar transporter), member A1/2/3
MPSKSRRDSHAYLKLGVLSILVIQNCSLILIMRYSRVIGDQQSRYIISTAVVLSELIKLLISLFVNYWKYLIPSSYHSLVSSSSISSTAATLSSSPSLLDILTHDFYHHRVDILKLCIPSGLYVIQNNLQYLSTSYLPVAIFQILSQLKIVTTAIFSILLLKNKKLSFKQWLSILTLTCGVGLVQYSQQLPSSSGSGDSNARDVEEEQKKTQYLYGVVCVLFSCITSGFSGVYFERILKSGSLSLWMRNTHLSLIGLILSGVSSFPLLLPFPPQISQMVCWYNDHEAITANGFFHGYTPIVWIVVLLQAGGGLVCPLFSSLASHLINSPPLSLSASL